MGDFSDIYADGYSVSIGPFGVTVTLQRSDPAMEAGGVSDRNEVVGRVRMSSTLAKALAQGLNDALAHQPNIQQASATTKH
jgi:hypothetical protein